MADKWVTWAKPLLRTFSSLLRPAAAQTGGVPPVHRPVLLSESKRWTTHLQVISWYELRRQTSSLVPVVAVKGDTQSSSVLKSAGEFFFPRSEMPEDAGTAKPGKRTLLHGHRAAGLSACILQTLVATLVSFIPNCPTKFCQCSGGLQKPCFKCICDVSCSFCRKQRFFRKCTLLFLSFVFAFV